MEDDGDVEVVRDRRRDFGDEILRIRVLRVPESEKFPEGIKYAFHYGRTDGNDPILRYDSDLLHGLKAVASGHRMTGLSKQTVPVPTRTQREPAAYRRNSRFLPHYRAVARSRRPHRNPCHCRVTNRQRSSSPLVCWGPASHRFRSRPKYVGPRQKRSVGHPVRPQYGGFSPGVSARPPPVRSSVPTRCRNTPHSPEGGGVRSYLYHHGVHERHSGSEREKIDFPGTEALLRRFIRELPDDVSP